MLCGGVRVWVFIWKFLQKTPFLYICLLILLKNQYPMQNLKYPIKPKRENVFFFFFFFFFCPQLILQKSNGQFQGNLSFVKIPVGV